MWRMMEPSGKRHNGPPTPHVGQGDDEEVISIIDVMKIIITSQNDEFET